MNKSYQNLIAYQRAEDFAVQIYGISANFPKDEAFGLTSQIRRAAVSIPGNIAEGYSRNGSKEKVRFLNISLGSLAEVESYLNIALRLKYISKQQYELIYNLKDGTGKVLWGLMKKIKNPEACVLEPGA